jgi:hypothetical protein
MSKNKDKMKEYAKKYRETERYKETQKKYRQTDKYKESRRQYAKTRKYGEIHQDYALRRKYGITLEAYQALFESQNGKCAICGKEEIIIGKIKPFNRRKNLSVDHNHLTGKIRGLLCQRCNGVLGYVFEDIDILQKAINYLKEHESL